MKIFMKTRTVAVDVHAGERACPMGITWKSGCNRRVQDAHQTFALYQHLGRTVDMSQQWTWFIPAPYSTLSAADNIFLNIRANRQKTNS